jgi:hypothetical protein
MPIVNLSSPTFKPTSPLNDFPLPPSNAPVRSTGSVSSLQIFPSQSLAEPAFPFREPTIHTTSSLPTLRTSSEQQRPKRLSKTLLKPRPESPRKKPTIPTPTFSPRKRFKSDETFVHVPDGRSAFDDWNPADEDPSVKERVEMSFESVRLEKDVDEVVGLGMRIPIHGVGVGTPRVGDRNVSGGSEGWMSPLTPVPPDEVL